MAEKVTFCHAAPPDDVKMYVEITIDVNGVGPLVEGQGGHANRHDDDIIPAFGFIDENGEHAEFDGKNLNDPGGSNAGGSNGNGNNGGGSNGGGSNGNNGNGGGELAFTGTTLPSMSLAAIGAGILLIGTGLVLLPRRTRAKHA